MMRKEERGGDASLNLSDSLGLCDPAESSRAGPCVDASSDSSLGAEVSRIVGSEVRVPPGSTDPRRVPGREPASEWSSSSS
eukprot:916783-Prorocentrum_minimum.AAC.1